MNKEEINQDELVIHGEDPSTEGKIMVEDNVYIIVTQAFCPKGHNLVGVGKHLFDGYPGICVSVTDGKKSGLLELSPFHGDPTKVGISFDDGQVVKVTCPTCGIEFESIGKCTCVTGNLRKIYLSKKLTEAYMIALCDTWGCYLSRVIDDNELFSEFTDSSWD
ncbi:hypothetical protein KKF84_07580 [Myxococcota bacterium]|nr:hypothetical protein [Myxococcota bacterium]